MPFKTDVADQADGAYIAFSQTQYTKNGFGATVNQNLETLDGTGARDPGLCAGLSAAFLIVMKNLVSKTPDMTMVDMVKGFKDYVCTADGAAVVATVQLDVDRAGSSVEAEVAVADFFNEGIGHRSLKHGGIGATVSGKAVSNHDLSNFIATTPGFDILSMGSASGTGHTIAAVNLAIVGKKPQIVVYDPNGGFTQLAKDPNGQMAKFVTAWFSSKWGNKFAGYPFIFSRYS